VRLFLFERLQTLLHICLKVLPQYTKEQDSAQFKHTWNFLIDVLASVRALHDRQFQSVSTLCALHPSNEQIIPEQTSCVYSDGLSNTQESLHTNSDPEPVASKYYDSFLFNARQMALLRAANLHDSGLAAIQHQTQLAISRVIDKNSLDAQLCRSKQETMEYATRLQKSEEDLRAITEQAAELQLHLDCLRRENEIQQRSSLASVSAFATAASAAAAEPVASAGTHCGQLSATTKHSPASSQDKMNEENHYLLDIEEP